jgi:hypothetical protein
MSDSVLALGVGAIVFPHAKMQTVKIRLFCKMHNKSVSIESSSGHNYHFKCTDPTCPWFVKTWMQNSKPKATVSFECSAGGQLSKRVPAIS